MTTTNIMMEEEHEEVITFTELRQQMTGSKV